jgi:hypothetical protein
MPMTALLVLLLVAASPTDPITKKNWKAHPRIAAIRAKVEAIDKAIAAKKYEKDSKRLCEVPSLDMERHIWRDETGGARRYQWGGGSDDSSYTHTAWYDEQGQLLFVHATEGHVPSRSIAFRLYFEAGKQIWKDRQASGEGPDSGAEGFPEKYIAKDPSAGFGEPPNC